MTLALRIGTTTRDCSRWRIVEPRIGQWVAYVRCDALDAAPGDVAQLGDDWAGVVRDIVPEGQLSQITIAAGADALAAPTTPSLQPTTVAAQAILDDLCSQASERAGAAGAAKHGSWRTRGQSFRVEVERLARFTSGGAWRYMPSGAVTLVVDGTEAEPPGRLIGADGDARIYADSDGHAQPLAGRLVDGLRVAHALFLYTGQGQPTVSLWRERARVVAGETPTIGGEIRAVDGGRVTVRTDDGAILAGIPLLQVPGYVATAQTGTRVLVLDLGDDPRATVALAGADGGADAIELAGGESEPTLDTIGRVVRFGDMIMMPVLGVPTPTVVIAPPGPAIVSRVKA